MIQISDFDGIAGYVWGAHYDPSGRTHLSAGAPTESHQQLNLVGRVLALAPFQMPVADLLFADFRLLIRRGCYGVLLLVCERDANSALVDVVLMESRSEEGDSSVMSLTDSNFSAVQSLSLSTAPIPGEIVEELLDLWTQVLGPLARAFAKKDTQAAGLDLEQIQTRDWSRLLNILAARIDNEEKREHFLDCAVLLKTRF